MPGPRLPPQQQSAALCRAPPGRVLAVPHPQVGAAVLWVHGGAGPDDEIVVGDPGDDPTCGGDTRQQPCAAAAGSPWGCQRPPSGRQPPAVAAGSPWGCQQLPSGRQPPAVAAGSPWSCQQPPSGRQPPAVAAGLLYCPAGIALSSPGFSATSVSSPDSMSRRYMSKQAGVRRFRPMCTCDAIGQAGGEKWARQVQALSRE